MPFEFFPNTNFHDMNLDYILEKTQKIDDNMRDSQSSADAAKASEEAAKASEDAAKLSEENAKASEEAAKDYADNIADPVSGIVTDWLEENITQETGYVLDASLTSAAAAAPAKTVGDAINNLHRAIGYKSKIIENAFISESGVVTASVPATPWNLLCINLNPNDVIASINLTAESISVVYGFFTSEPSMGSTTYNNQRISTGSLSAETVYMPQTCYWIAIRYNPSDYPDVLLSKIVDVNKSILVQNLYQGDLNNIFDSGVYYADGNALNRPTPNGAYMVISLCAVPGAYMQIAIGWSSVNYGIQYVRTYTARTWTDWISYDRMYEIDNRYRSRPYYIAIGDSLMYGAKWLDTETAPYYEIVRTDVVNRIPTRIANAVGSYNNFLNAAVGGAYYVGSGNNTIISQLQNIDITNAKLITIAGGRNDSSNPLGDKNSLPSDGTICGAIKEIVNYIYSQNKKTQIVVVQVTPNTNDNSNVFTRVYSGGWSLNSYAEKVGEMCEELNIGFVTWNGCAYFNHWADYTGAGNNNAHPNNDEAYLQMGNFIAAKISAFYAG